MTKEPAGQPSPETSQRLDKWLWFARVAKSRTLAATAVTEGKIKVNRVKAEKASQTVKVGDVITSRLYKNVRVLRVAALGERRGPAAEARQLYEDLTPPQNPEQSPPSLAWAERTAGAGRPTKRDRRLIDELKGKT
ncbi:RNA-binding S4 domain-containing protein [Hyphomicrobium sp.]|uniref:RNA-binding S4 domain-containing protein n=1 Tax=Hyphomicrobium sp. TaxID=82 RepID=UPI002E36C84D|nr:RNA-binding S4 domain-containing protein [Hyphomicrobium sp.]HEX2840736.1 RNA-binding S4 domain-containing protein [Hyphomicrobium sp.]